MSLADAVLFVVDTTRRDHRRRRDRGARCSGDRASRSCSRRTRSTTCAARPRLPALWNLGLGEPYAVSALHGRGSGDLLDAILGRCPKHHRSVRRARGGRAGSRSSASRTSASPACSTGSPASRGSSYDSVAGTTVDPVDEIVKLGGRTWHFIDTAGIRRRVREASGHEYYASLRTSAAIERAEVAVVVIDGGQPLTEQDQRIISSVEESGRAVVIAFNKWDLVDEERRLLPRPRDRA